VLRCTCSTTLLGKHRGGAAQQAGTQGITLDQELALPDLGKRVSRMASEWQRRRVSCGDLSR